MALTLRVMTDWLGDPSLVIRYSCRFGRPLVVPDTDQGVDLRMSGRISDVAEDRLTAQLQAAVRGAAVLSRVVCEVLPPPADSPAGREVAAALARLG
jgi:hypothetical protein